MDKSLKEFNGTVRTFGVGDGVEDLFNFADRLQMALHGMRLTHQVDGHHVMVALLHVHVGRYFGDHLTFMQIHMQMSRFF